MVIHRYLIPLEEIIEQGGDTYTTWKYASQIEGHFINHDESLHVTALQPTKEAGNWKNSHCLIAVKGSQELLDALDIALPSDVIQLNKTGILTALRAKGMTIPDGATKDQLRVKVFNWLGLDPRNGFSDYPEVN